MSEIHYYPVGRGIGYLVIGALLLVMVVAIQVAAAVLWVPLLGVAMGVAAVWLGLRSLLDRKKYPMTLADDQISFYVRKTLVEVPRHELAAVFYNTKGFDKRASLRKHNGETVDIPVIYGLNDLVKRIGRRYDIATSV